MPVPLLPYLIILMGIKLLLFLYRAHGVHVDQPTASTSHQERRFGGKGGLYASQDDMVFPITKIASGPDKHRFFRPLLKIPSRSGASDITVPSALRFGRGSQIVLEPFYPP